MITKIGWPTLKKQVNAHVWRVLDLSGLTKSVRESRNFTKSGFVFVDGNRMTSLGQTVSTGDPFLLELRFPNGRIKSQNIMLVPSNRLANRTARQASPGTNHYINDPGKINYRG